MDIRVFLVLNPTQVAHLSPIQEPEALHGTIATIGNYFTSKVECLLLNEEAVGLNFFEWRFLSFLPILWCGSLIQVPRGWYNNDSPFKYAWLCCLRQ